MSCESPAVRVPAKDVEPELDAERCRDFCGWHLDTPVTLASCQNVVCLSVCLSGKGNLVFIYHYPLVSKAFPSLSGYHLAIGVPT